MDVEFGKSFLINKQESWHDAEARRFDCLLYLANLFAIEQEFAVAPFHMVVVGALLVLRDIHVLDPHLALNHIAVSIHQTRFTFADALNLGASQDEPCRVFIHEQVVELGSLVLDVYVFPLVGNQRLCHSLTPLTTLTPLTPDIDKLLEMLIDIVSDEVRHFFFHLDELVVEVVELRVLLEERHELLVCAIFRESL